MSIYRCKMCGGDLELQEGSTSCVCEYCGTRQTIPNHRNDDLFDLMSELWKHPEYDEAGNSNKKTFRKNFLEAQTTMSALTCEVTSLLKRGYMALEDNDWEKADRFFEMALNHDTESSDAWLGKFLAANKQSGAEINIDSLLSCYKAIPEKETLTAFPFDEAHVRKIVQKYNIPEYFPESTIRDHYQFDNHYQSEVSFLIRQKSKIMDILYSDKLLVRAKRYEKDREKERFTAWIHSVEIAIDRRIRQAKEDDQDQIKEMKNRYMTFLKEKDNLVQKQWQKASARREQNYQKYIREMKKAGAAGKNIIFELNRVKRDFSAPGMINYKDSAKYAEECQNQIIRYKGFEQKRIEQEILDEQLDEEIWNRFFRQ